MGGTTSLLQKAWHRADRQLGSLHIAVMKPSAAFTETDPG